MHVNLVVQDPHTGVFREIQQELTAMPQAGDAVFLPMIEGLPRQMVKRIGHVITPDGVMTFILLIEDQDRDADGVWEDVVR